MLCCILTLLVIIYTESVSPADSKNVICSPVWRTVFMFLRWLGFACKDLKLASIICEFVMKFGAFGTRSPNVSNSVCIITKVIYFKITTSINIEFMLNILFIKGSSPTQ